VFFLRYFDVCLVVASAPLVLIGGMPRLGYACGAGAWLATRAGAALLQERARRTRSAGVRAGLLMAAMMGRVWLVALAVIVARYAGGRDDGIMAAALVLSAFSVYFVMSLVTRGDAVGPRTGAHGRVTPS
jgi:hypothetical protein